MTLENLLKVKQLKREAFDKREFIGLLKAATISQMSRKTQPGGIRRPL